MQTSDKGLLMLMRHEAVVLSTYKDSVGVLTLGVGHTAAAGPPKPIAGMKITLAEALALLKRDIAKYEAGVNKAVKAPLLQREYDALVSFHYNTGSIAKASLVKKLNAGNKLAAADGLLAWNKAGGKVSKGLTSRRKEERALFLGGDYGDTSKVPVYDKYPGKVRAMSTVGLLGTTSTGEANMPHNFGAALGRAINSPLAQVLAKAAAGAARDAASKPGNEMSATAVGSTQAQADIKDEVLKEIASKPELQHVTNSERWFQKRSRWAAIIGTAAPVIGLALKVAGVEWEFGVGEQVAITDAFMSLGGLWAAYLALRAGIATKPLGA